jgi:glycosyltransferase involved in cell wall biosynthesis
MASEAGKGTAEMNTRARPLVTIALTTYNRADTYLKEALGSAVAQTYPNLEIVVSDNGSSDATEDVVKSVGDPRIRYFRHPTNIGVTNNANFCVQEAHGDYLLLLHDDDAVDKDFVEACIDALGANTTVGVIRTGVRVIDGTGNILSQTFNRVAHASTVDFFLGWFSGRTAWYLCNTLYNTQALQAIGGFRSPTNHLCDCVATARLAAEAGHADVHDIKASFRRHQSNRGSTIHIADWCEDSLFLLELMCKLAPDRQDEVRRQGLRFLCTSNYRRASRSRRRLSAYLTVYRTFSYCRSPWAFLLSTSAAQWRRYLRARVSAGAAAWRGRHGTPTQSGARDGRA